MEFDVVQVIMNFCLFQVHVVLQDLMAQKVALVPMAVVVHQVDQVQRDLEDFKVRQCQLPHSQQCCCVNNSIKNHSNNQGKEDCINSDH